MKKITTLFIITLLLALGSVCMAAKQPIVVMGAMRVEVEEMMQTMAKPKFKEVAGHYCAFGKIDGYPVVIMETRVGMVNAASATTIAMERFNPLCVLTTGTSGAQRDDLKVGDIVLCEKFCYYNYYITPYAPRGGGSDSFGWNYQDSEVFAQGKWDKTRYMESNKDLINIAYQVPYTAGRLVKGTTASGDIWLRECDKIDEIHRIFNTDSEEMESFAVAAICSKYNVPVLGIRVISDNGLVTKVEDEQMDSDEFYEKVCHLERAYVLNVVRAIVRAKK